MVCALCIIMIAMVIGEFEKWNNGMHTEYRDRDEECMVGHHDH